MQDAAESRAKFHNMLEGTREDWSIIAGHQATFAQALPDRVLAHLRLLAGDYGGFAVDRLQHSLQTATRALRDGRDDEYVVCALLHDIGDTLGRFNHADVAARDPEAVRVRAEPVDGREARASSRATTSSITSASTSNMREQFRDHPWFDVHRGVLRRVRPGGVRPGLRHAAARDVRADGAQADAEAAAVDLHARAA